MKQPKTILAGVILYFSSALLGLPSLLVNAAYAPIEQSKPQIIVGGLIFLALYILLGYKIHIGRNWARQTFAVVTVFGLAVMLSTPLVGQHHYLVTYISRIQTLLSIAALALFYLQGSNLWFYLAHTRNKA